jgi:hypothetical protein
MNGADGKADRIFDFQVPPGKYGGHEAACPEMGAEDYRRTRDYPFMSFVEHRPANNAIREHTDMLTCLPLFNADTTRARFQAIYRGILDKLAKGCAENKVNVPGSKYVKPDFSGARGLGTIDTGTGTGRR